MKNSKCFLLLLIISAFMAGCEKDEGNSNPPAIEIFEPEDFSAVTAGDSLHVKTLIKDDNGIDLLQIRLYDHEMKIKEVIYSKSYDNVQTTVEIDNKFVISSDDLGSGFCYLQVQAKSIGGQNSEYITLRSFSSKPLLKNLVILSRLSNQNHVLGVIPPGKEYSIKTYEIGVNADAVMVNSHSQLIHVLSKDPGKLMTYDANNFKILWHTNPAYAYPVYTDFFVKDELVFVSSENGEVSAYNPSGIFKYATVQDQEYVPGQFAVSEDYIVTYAERRSGQNKLIRTFYNPTGAFMQHTPLEESIVEIFPTANKDFLLFGNKEGNAVILSYDVEMNRYEEKDSFQGEIFSVEKVSNSEYILKTVNGWYSYNADGGIMISMPNLDSKEVISYDVLNKIIFATAGTDVESFNAANGNSQGTTEAQQLILDMDVLYNKNPDAD